MKKRAKVILIISPIVLAIAIITYYQLFMKLDKYSYNRSTNTIQKDGVEYVLPKSFPSTLVDNSGKTIGKINGSDSESQERWVVKINGVDEHEMFLVTGLMNEELFVRKDKVEEFNKTLPQ